MTGPIHLVFNTYMTNTAPATTPRAAALRTQMAALAASQSTEVLSQSWATVAQMQADANTDGDRRTLALALDTMTTELQRRGVTEETLDRLLWVVRMNTTD